MPHRGPLPVDSDCDIDGRTHHLRPLIPPISTSVLPVPHGGLGHGICGSGALYEQKRLDPSIRAVVPGPPTHPAPSAHPVTPTTGGRK